MTSKKKLTPEQKAFIRSVKSVIGTTRSLNKIVSKLMSRGYMKVAEGGYKNVLLRDGDKYCIKVYKEKNDWMEDSYIVPKEISKYYVHPIYINKLFMIQRWVKKAVKFDKTKAKKLPKSYVNTYNYDLHSDNIKYDGHRQVIIDFMYCG